MPNTPKGGGISEKFLILIEEKNKTNLNLIEIPKEMGLIVRSWFK